MLSSSLSTRVAAAPRNRGSRYAFRASAAEAPAAQKTCFIAMNVFKVKPECAEDFENVWKNRESHLKEMPGFVRFALLKCSNVPNKYISQSTWESEEAFRGWTQSQQFSKAHGEADKDKGGSKRPNVGAMLEGPPAPEFFSSVTMTE
ncbi:hypothetical protein OEZ85_003815 [Tetradesmus obliquus]|uniref:ABM domain-containing protein n=1 Tax=Tetradesmus obliquus TaxID=3088 RepID=A0ABY8UCT1_TETOB|nr:hypothetical protein OEZ85_003815 [Tetradesmus obliquus]